MRVRLIHIKNETDIPVVMAVCHTTSKSYPGLILGLGCHTNPEIATQKALFEMEISLIDVLACYPERRTIRKEKIRNPLDHMTFYLDPGMYKHWKFLMKSTMTSVFQRASHELPDGTEGLLLQIARSLKETNHRVIYVDITPPDVRRLGLHVVKVFITDFQPMFFGLTHLRLNLRRLYDLPAKLGFNKERLATISGLNLTPHPLP